MNNTDQVIQLARQKMGNAVACSLCGQPYVCMNLRDARICSSKACTSKWQSRPRWVNSDRQFLNDKEIDAINNNTEKVVLSGAFHDVR